MVGTALTRLCPPYDLLHCWGCKNDAEKSLRMCGPGDPSKQKLHTVIIPPH